MSDEASKYQVGGVHYKTMDIQPWSAMQAWSTHSEFQAHLRLTAIKYLARAGSKGPARTDIEKARHYLDRWLEGDSGGAS